MFSQKPGSPNKTKIASNDESFQSSIVIVNFNEESMKRSHKAITNVEWMQIVPMQFTWLGIRLLVKIIEIVRFEDNWKIHFQNSVMYSPEGGSTVSVTLMLAANNFVFCWMRANAPIELTNIWFRHQTVYSENFHTTNAHAVFGLEKHWKRAQPKSVS